MVEIECINKNDSGRITRVDYDGQARYHAAARCLEWNDREYYVTVVPVGVSVSCWTGYDNAEQAAKALAAWTPTASPHIRDRERALGLIV